jgi:superfamily II DNA or RNA helicase
METKLRYIPDVLDIDRILGEEFIKNSDIKREDLERQVATADALIEKVFEDREAGLSILGDEVGMGKTYVGLMVLSYFLFKKKGRKQALLVTPNSSILQSKWEREIHEFSNKYLREDRKQIFRPLVVRDFSHFIESMIDPGYNSLGSVSRNDARLKAFSWYFEEWLKREDKKYLKDFVFYKVGWWEFEDGLRFISESAVYAYLDEQKSKNIAFKRDIEKLPNNSESMLKRYFSDFIFKQKDYLPNIILAKTDNLATSLRSNSSVSRKLILQVLRKLLYNKQNKSAVLKIFQELLPGPRDYFRSRMDSKFYDHMLETSDLWGIFDGDYPLIEKDSEVKKLWKDFTDWWEPQYKRLTPEIANEAQNKLKPFFAAVIKARFKRSHFGFCIIDEVHNWKEKNNRALDFEQNLNAVIPHKLLMSATPFQINPEELNNILSVTTHPKDVLTQNVISVLFRDNDRGIVREAIKASKIFYEEWEKLSVPEVQSLNRLLETPSGVKDLLEHKGLRIGYQKFIEAMASYRKCQDRLSAQLSKVFVRHTRKGHYRHFHAGHKFNLPLENFSGIDTTTLYETTGKLTREDGFALFEFVCMRADQHLRAQQDKTAYAHLLNGMTSSFSAFQESLEKKQRSILKMSDDAVSYLATVDEIIKKKQFQHAKVKATVERAMANWENGKKTLIFCYRIKTVEEITILIEKEISGRLGKVRSKLTKQKFKDFAFAKDRLWMSILNSLGPERGELVQETIRFLSRPSFQEELNELLTACRVTKSTKQKVVYEGIDSLLLKQFLPRLIPTESKFIELLRRLVPEVTASELILAKLQVFDSKQSPVLPEPDDESSDEDYSVMINHYKQDLKSGAGHFWTDLTNENFRMLNAEIFQFLDTELEATTQLSGLLQVRHDLYAGLAKIAFRKDIISRMIPKDELTKDVVKSAFFGTKLGAFSIGEKLLDYLKSLKKLSGSISSSSNSISKRKSLWKVMHIQESQDKTNYIAKLTANSTKQVREDICQAFNSPLIPDILVCTSIGQEGIDLHLYCDDVIHHDIPWNPAILEQRTGRIDRVNSLTERRNSRLAIGIPFLGNGYEQYQYDVLIERAHRFSVLMGDEVMKKVLEDSYAEQELESKASEAEDGMKDADERQALVDDSKGKILPAKIVDYLQMDFAVVKKKLL